MTLKQLYRPRSEPMRVAGLMSGSGTNLVKIIEHEKMLKSRYSQAPYSVVAIFSDNPKSRAQEIGSQYNIPTLVSDLSAFYKARGKPKRDMEVRADFDAKTSFALASLDVDVLAYAGYMAIATDPLVKGFLGINVHPAKLSIMQGDKRKYTGDNAVRDAILAGEKFIASTTHIVERRVDYGGVLMVSRDIPVILPQDFNPKDLEQVKKVSDENQDRLKKEGDWLIFPQTLEYIAEGRFSKDASNLIHFNGKPVPNGVAYSDWTDD